MAIWAVSGSGISTTMITSGSCRRNARSAVAKVRPIAGFTWDWLMPWISYSTGSSMVRILRDVSLRMLNMVASVVVLPLPVGPVMTIMPCGSASSRAIFRQQAQHGRFAVLGRHGGDADIDLAAADVLAGGAVLRQPALGDVKTG